MRRERAAAALALAGIAAFVALASFDIRVPGLYYDELFQLTTALAFVKGGLGSAVAWVPGTEVSIAGHPLPLMAHSYIGAVKTIAFVPVAAAFGISPASVRVFTIAVAALSLVFTYLFARRLFRSAAVAAVGIVLLATDPSFVFYSRVDFGPSVFMFLFKAIGLWQLVDWWRSGRLRSLVLGAFALGLGVYDKANFLWIVAAVVVAALLLDYRGVRRRLDRRSILWAAGAFALGCLPFLAYNASWPPRTIEPALEGTLHVSGGNPSGGPFTQLGLRVQQLVRLLDGETLSELLTGGHGGAPVLPALALAAAAGIALAFAVPSLRARVRPAMFVVLSGFLVLVASGLTPGGSYPHHVLLAYPAPHLALAAVVVEGAELVHRRVRLAATLAGAAALTASVAVSFTTTTAILSRLRHTGGTGNFSDGIYNLERYLVRHDRDRRLVIVDWGIFQNIVALSDGDLRATEVWDPLNSNGRVRGKVLEQLDDPAARYVLHAPGATNFPRARSRFFAALRKDGRRARLVHTVTTRLRAPLFEIYRVA
ncbi:MAG TPA: glycosyltransferase family 39 protein [Gaiellaceae bacterium]|nr:glycosyltransferase family 39 protein [Gaiellaceae bacterium]